MEVEEVERESSRNNIDDQQEAVEESNALLETGGVELLGLGGEFATSLVQRQPPAKSTSTTVSFAALQAREQLLILLVDQRLVNPASQQMFPIVQNEGKLRE
jgi:S-adenosylmethionine synthetase